MNSLLKIPIDVESYDKSYEIFNDAYDVFTKELLNRGNRPDLFGKFVFIDERKGHDNKERAFWHISSIGQDEDYKKYDMYPCNNHLSYAKCNFKCDIEHPENYLKEENSIPCIYRAHKMAWVSDIINLANKDQNHENLRVWRNFHKNSRENRLYIRFIDALHDFILVFSIVYVDKRKSDIKWYRLLTAYPVVLKRYKRRYDKEFEQYKA